MESGLLYSKSENVVVESGLLTRQESYVFLIQKRLFLPATHSSSSSSSTCSHIFVVPSFKSDLTFLLWRSRSLFLNSFRLFILSLSLQCFSILFIYHFQYSIFFILLLKIHPLLHFINAHMLIHHFHLLGFR